MGATEPGDDGWLDIELDEAFIAGAPVREPSARARANRAVFRDLDRPPPPTTVRARLRSGRRWVRRHGRALTALGVVCALFIGLGVANERRDPDARSLQATGAAPLGSVWSQPGRPTPSAGAGEPLGTPATVQDDGGDHRFLLRQPVSREPVAYDPCRRIAVVVDEDRAPPGAEGLLQGALDDVAAISGLRFEVEGVVDEPPTVSRPPFDPGRYGDRWSPVLVAWTDPGQVDRLRGDVAGIGGSTAVPTGGGPLVYVSGLIALDGPQLEALLDEPDGDELARAIIVHELGHLVGLDHVDDPAEIMHDTASRDVVTPQAGDRAGLARLGSGPCVGLL